MTSTSSTAVELHGAWVSADSIVSYLSKHGWTIQNRREHAYTRLSYSLGTDRDGRQVSVVLPLDPSKADFIDLLDDAIAKIAEVTGMTDRRLLTDLNIGFGDKLSFRSDVPTPQGSIPWVAGGRLIVSATKMLEAAAKAERRRLSYFGNRYWNVAKAFLDSVRMGQTGLGSYIVTAFTPTGSVTAPSEIEIFDSDGVRIEGRAVTNTLANALQATRESIDFYNQSSSLERFDEAVEVGVSFELARSLVDILQGANAADITFNWDTSVAAGSVLDITIPFEPHDASVLERAAIRLAQTFEPEIVHVIGTVTLLDRPSVGSPGVIRLEVLGGIPAKKIRVRLSEHEYGLAIEAFRNGAALAVTGRMEREGRMYWLYDVTEVFLISTENLPFPQQLDLLTGFDPENWQEGD